MVIDEPARRAQVWLDRNYDGLVELTDARPFAQNAKLWLLGCRYAAGEPMLAATLAVPKTGERPFPLANSDPLDESLNVPDAREGWRWRVNARNCLIATDAAVSGRPASALPWRPSDELPGWWERLVRGCFPGAEVATCASWSEVTSAIAAGGPGTRGAIWLRRQVRGVPITGHLLYAHHRDGAAVVLDGQRGSLARLDDNEVGELVLARFRRAAAAPPSIVLPWRQAAADFAAAVAKANQWLAHVYDGEVVLVDPAPADEMRRGWLFACTTQRFRETGDWREQMLDAAVVVPKAAGAQPFGLPNPDPWTWLARWNDGAGELPKPPATGSAAWFASTMAELGPAISSTAHDGWAGVMDEIFAFPGDARSLVWVRRRDERGRETVGNLLVAAKDAGGNVRFVDALAEGGAPEFEPDAAALRVIRYR